MIALIAILVTFHRPLFFGNFGVVDRGKAYRSAQPEAGLERTIRTYGLGSVVNLRGGSEADAFYGRESEVTDRLGVEFYDLPVSASRRPTRRELMLQIRILERCRYPLLIHCKWGSDRTGLMSALYRMVVRGDPPEAAIGEFTLAYGHFPLFGPEKLHTPIDEYARWLRDRGLRHDPARFRLWVEREYVSADAFTIWPTIEPGPRLRRTAAADSIDRR
ncbi:MAG: protein tyrosine/serine phosphatase [Planctomycetota bacterium]|nr:protein tyrosine/serine phosphatase [Planctomycetota bacterium]